MTFLELIFSVMVGLFILQNFKFGLIASINQVRNGQMTQEEFIKGSIGKAIGAILLIIPGFFTDILGLCLQFSLFTILITKLVKFKPKSVNNTYNYTQANTNKQNNIKGDEDVIDVEVIDNNKPINK
jgi:2-isopropylmalate synthase/UPF0716 protein FxsA